MITVYGIKNCDTMKKAFNWLNDHGVAYDFHDYKKAGADETVLQNAIAQHGWEQVINRRGTTWRKLDDAIKNTLDADSALQIALEQPSMIKRPLLRSNDEILLGFDPATYQTLIKKAA